MTHYITFEDAQRRGDKFWSVEEDYDPVEAKREEDRNYQYSSERDEQKNNW
jgi:hypothetical protein